LKFGVQEWIEDRLEELAEILAVAVGCFSVIDGLVRLQRSPLSPGKGVDLGEGTLYPVRYRLEEAGLLRAEWEADNGRRGPRRRIYHLTHKGRHDLARHREAWAQFVTIVGGILGAPT
jgi:PadR family transcriptional regulator, regulatory protein PadR